LKHAEKGNNLAHHLIQSFEPGESTPEQAHEIGKRLADEITKGRYEYVLTTHTDKGHIHNHLIFCAASFIDYRKYISNKKSYFAIRNFSDKLCREYNLSVVKPGQDKGRSYAEYNADRQGGSWKSKLKAAIDAIIPQAKDLEDFLKRLESAGYEIKRGKYISVRAQGQERFTRTKTLGADYAEDAITKRIAEEYAMTAPEKKAADIAFAAPDEQNAGIDIFAAGTPEPAKPEKAGYVRPAPAVNLIIDIENCVKAQQSAGFARWRKIQNLKEAAKTLNFLTENKLLQYGDLENRADEAAAAFDTAADALKAAEKRLADMAGLMKRIANYQRTKPVYDGLKTVKDKGAYRRGHESEIILHEAAAKALRKQAGDGGKLPNPSKLQAEYARLTEKKNALRLEYGKLRQQAREYGVVKKNVDSILDPGTERARGKKRSAEL
jgi:flagellar basal body rod protein FlgC